MANQGGDVAELPEVAGHTGNLALTISRWRLPWLAAGS